MIRAIFFVLLLMATEGLCQNKYVQFSSDGLAQPEFDDSDFAIFISRRDWKNFKVSVSDRDTVFGMSRWYESDGFNYWVRNSERNLGNRLTDKKRFRKVAFGWEERIRLPWDWEYRDQFRWRVFNDMAYFHKVDFSHFKFEEALFRGKFRSKSCIYGESQEFRSVLFQDSTWFEKNEFSHEANFEYVRFLKSLIFSENLLNENVNFRGAYFNGPTIFFNQDFHEAIFSNSTFKHKDSYFSRVHFKGSASFSGCEISTGKFFRDVILPDTLDFTDVKFAMEGSEKFDFRNCYYPGGINQGKRCLIYLAGTDATRLILPADRFRLARLYPDRGKVTDSTKIFDEYEITAIEALIKNCKEAGMEESARDWDIYLRKIKAIDQFGWTVGAFLNSVNYYWWNFGYSKRYILWGWLPGLFFVFLLLNFILRKWLLSFYKDDELGKNFGLSPDDDKHKGFTYIFFLTAVLYFGLKIRHSAVDYRNSGGVLYLYFMYMVGSLHVAFALSYILNIY